MPSMICKSSFPETSRICCFEYSIENVCKKVLISSSEVKKPDWTNKEKRFEESIVL